MWPIPRLHLPCQCSIREKRDSVVVPRLNSTLGLDGGFNSTRVQQGKLGRHGYGVRRPTSCAGLTYIPQRAKNICSKKISASKNGRFQRRESLVLSGRSRSPSVAAEAVERAVVSQQTGCYVAG